MQNRGDFFVGQTPIDVAFATIKPLAFVNFQGDCSSEFVWFSRAKTLPCTP